MERKYSVGKALNLTREVARKYNLTFATMREIITRYSVGLRTVELQQKNKEANQIRNESLYQATLKK